MYCNTVSTVQAAFPGVWPSVHYEGGTEVALK